MDARTLTRDARFDEVVTTAQDLKKIVGPANRWFTSKILTRLDRHCRQFIAASPFVVVGSADPLGLVDLSPREIAPDSSDASTIPRSRFRIGAATGGWIRFTTCCRIRVSA